jgi:hypothetical protein
MCTEIGTWEAGQNFILNGIEFCVPPDADSSKIVIYKTPAVLTAYAEKVAPTSPKNIIEIGVAMGGSTVFFNELFDPSAILAIDIQDATTSVFKNYRETDRGKRIKLFTGIDQSNGEDLTLLRKNIFGDDRIDLVVDDASHLYEPSTKTFETLFPTLRAGGAYIVEDWGWAHWPDEYWQKDGGEFATLPALSNLMFQLLMACATRPDYVSRVDVDSAVCIIWRGVAAIPEGLPISNYYVNRGKSFHLT